MASVNACWFRHHVNHGRYRRSPGRLRRADAHAARRRPDRRDLRARRTDPEGRRRAHRTNPCAARGRRHRRRTRPPDRSPAGLLPGCSAARHCRTGGDAVSTARCLPPGHGKRLPVASGCCTSTRLRPALPFCAGAASTRSPHPRGTCGRRRNNRLRRINGIHLGGRTAGLACSIDSTRCKSHWGGGSGVAWVAARGWPAGLGVAWGRGPGSGCWFGSGLAGRGPGVVRKGLVEWGSGQGLGLPAG